MIPVFKTSSHDVCACKRDRRGSQKVLLTFKIIFIRLMIIYGIQQTKCKRWLFFLFSDFNGNSLRLIMKWLAGQEWHAKISTPGRSLQIMARFLRIHTRMRNMSAYMCIWKYLMHHWSQNMNHSWSWYCNSLSIMVFFLAHSIFLHTFDVISNINAEWSQHIQLA